MKLFEPIIIRGMKLKNRILMEPMEVGLGYRSRKARAFYVERAQGGVGAIVAPGLSVDLLLYDDTWGTPGAVSSFIEGLKKLTEDIHREDCKIGLQLFHAPRFPSGTGSPKDLRGDLVAPSRRVEPNPPVHPYVSAFDELRELTVAEIEQIIERFGKAAGNAKAAGFDFVEFHGSHGYFASQFFSLLDNWRDDKFGGSLTRRMTFGVECVKAIRKTVGDDYPLFFRLGATEYRPDGTNLQESVKFAQELEQAGVDAIDVTVCGPSYFFIPVPEFKPGTFVHQAEAIKEKVKVPVIAVGRIHKPELAEAILSQAKADLVGIGRQLPACCPNHDFSASRENKFVGYVHYCMQLCGLLP